MLIDEIQVSDLKTQKATIKKAVDKEDDKEILDRVESTLQSGDLIDRLSSVLKNDPDVKKLYRHISQVIVNIPGSLEEKIKFIDGFNKGFVKINLITSPGVVNDFKKIIPDPFAYKVFQALKDVVVQGVGPGEFALAALSPKIKSMGQKSGGGDLDINGIRVEVKGARQSETGKVSGGRWTDPRKADFNLSPIKDALVTYYGFDSSKSLTGAGWVQLRDSSTQVSKKDKEKVVDQIIAGNFRKYKGPTLNAVKQALMSGDEPEIRKTWAEACYKNYQAYSGFQAMLILDFSKDSSLYFTDYADAVDDIKVESVQLWGPEQSTAPKVKLKGPDKVVTTPAGQAKPAADQTAAQ